MNGQYECGDNGALIGYLYDECDETECLAIEAHMKVCPACAAELAALDSTRAQLTGWAPPETDLGFRLVPGPRSNRMRQWWGQPMPMWAQAAAAVVIFGAGLVLGVARGVEQDGTTEGTPQAIASGAAVPGGVTERDLTALEQRLRAELVDRRVAVTSPATPSSASDVQMLERVRALIDESEQRQRRELALRTAEVVRDIDAQRQSDWVRVQRALGQFEGTAGAEIQRQRQEINNLLQRVSQSPQ